MNNFLKVLLVFVVLVIVAGVGYLLLQRGPIKVGVLHSQTGTMAISEAPLTDAVLLAIAELNAAGGLLDRRVEAVVVDGRSDSDVFAAEAERLIRDENVVALFGCWTSDCRKRLKHVVEQHDHLLFYPVQYEGLEQSENIVYTGIVANQQILPALKWSMLTHGKRVFLVGSDYVFPRMANAIIVHQVERWRGQVVGEVYVPLESNELGEVVQSIAVTRPDVVINTLNGSSNRAFFRELHERDPSIPTMSFSIAEVEVDAIGAAVLEGHYAAWSYFQTIDSQANADFVRAFTDSTSHVVTDDPIEAAYLGVKLWALAVERAGSTNISDVRDAVRGQSVRTPGGMVYIDETNNHAWKAIRIGRVRVDGQFDIVWDSGRPIRPEPFPEFRSKLEWEEILGGLYEGWGGSWRNPSDSIAWVAREL